MNPLKESATWYAIRVEGQRGPFYASGDYGVRALFSDRKSAKPYCDLLRKHVCGKCKIVKVVVSISESDR